MYISGGGKQGGKGGCGGGEENEMGAGIFLGGGGGQERVRKSRAFGQAPERAIPTVNRRKLAF